MGTRSLTGKKSTWNPRIQFTPWKMGICAAAFALWLGTFLALDAVIPGDDATATKGMVQGTQVFTLTSSKSGWMILIMVGTFFSYPLLLFGIFWKPYSKSAEYLRYRKERENWLATTHWFLIALQRIVVGILLAFLVLVFVGFFVLEPLYSIHRVTIDGDTARLDSLCCSWSISRDDIQQVHVDREEEKGRGSGIYVYYSVTIELDDDTTFRLGEIKATPPGGNDDQRYQAFCDDLRAELMK
ncbi:hypothetical protein [Aeoliella sp.]|uniref:hypothetical protein n=1 Tax=Aeoliella sp. TaxID=2795800 RepID=UPI003CCBA9C6